MPKDAWSDSDRLELLDGLAYEITEQIRKGQRPNLDEYVARYPQVADEIREMFPFLADLELTIGEVSPKRDRSFPSRIPHIPGYRVLGRLGRGGMGVVYEAQHQLLDRRVAIKVLAESLACDSNARERFRREARSAGRLHHTNIVPIYEVSEDGETLYYTMQLIEGHGLDRIIDDLRELRVSNHESPLPRSPGSNRSAGVDVGHVPVSGTDLARSLLRDELQASNVSSDGDDRHASAAGRESAEKSAKVSTLEQTLAQPGSSSHSRSKWTRYYNALARLGMQVASALSYAHARGIIHRDIKPSNILLDAAGTAWVTDFGLARDSDTGLTKSTDIVGTFRYMAPERFVGGCDERSDVYSLGLTLYELLALEPAFREQNRAALMDVIRTRTPKSLREFDTRMPRDLETIVFKAIDKEPARRYASADELAADLQRFLSDEPIRARRVTYREKVFRWCRRNPAISVASCLAMIGLLATLLVLTLSNEKIRHTNVALQTAVSDRDHAIVGQQNALEQRGTALRQAESQRKQAEQNAAQAEELVRVMSTERGLLAGERREMALASLWFAEAAKRSVMDLESREANLVRAQAYATEAAKPLRLFDHTIPRQGHVLQLTFSPDSRKLASRAESIQRDWADLRMWDVESGEPVAMPPGIKRATAVSWSTDGSMMALGDEVGHVVVQHTTSPAATAEFDVASGDVIELAFSPAADRLVVVAGKELSLWQLSDRPTCLGRFEHPERIVCVTFSPSGDHLSTLCADGRARLFRVSNGVLTNPQMERGSTWQGPVWNAMSPLRPQFLDGGKTWAICTSSPASSNAEFLSLVGIDSGDTRQIPLDDAMVVAISPDQQYLFAGTRGGTDTLKQLNDGAKPFSYNHRLLQWAWSAAFHPDGTRLLVGCGEASMRLLRVPDLKPVIAPVEHTQTVTSVAVSPSGRLFATAELGGLLCVGLSRRRSRPVFGTV